MIGSLFPSLYFQRISAGVFNKGLGFAALYRDHLVLALFCIVFLAAATLLLAQAGGVKPCARSSTSTGWA